MATEADICRTWTTPKLQAVPWKSDPHSLAGQRTFTDGRIIFRGVSLSTSNGERVGVRCRNLELAKRGDPVALASSPASSRSVPLPRHNVAETRGETHLQLAGGTPTLRGFPALVFRVSPISDHGQPSEIIQFVGGADQLRNAVSQLLSLLYAA